MRDLSPNPQILRRSHPLALQLIERLRGVSQPCVLEVGIGNGRNSAALLETGISLVAIDDDPQLTEQAKTNFSSGRAHFRTSVYTRIEGDSQSFDGALSTHGLLHGTPAIIERALSEIARLLKTGAPLYAAFGSSRDARCGQGTRIADFVYAPESGDEIGVAHSYFDESQLRKILEPRFAVEALNETPVDDVVGRWAHTQPLHGAVHWLVRARAA